MTTPASPADPSNPSPIQPSQPSQPSQYPTSYVDPTGAWAKFLGTPDNPATAQEVQMFMNGLLKFFNIIIQQQQAAFKRSMDELKKAQTGDE